ncbi:MAG: hypothetical protein LBU40_06420, partial [Methanobrevibacter sp.]|nr:hypothetical protein [Methanobrevibacter sp.]
GSIDGSVLIDKGKEISPLDLIEVYVKEPPIDYDFQKENLLLDQSYPIKFIKKFDLDEFLKFYPSENHNRIFGSKWGFIKEDTYGFDSINSSLIFIEVEELQISEKNKASFFHNYNKYQQFSITDPQYRQLNQNIDSAYLVISFPETEFKDYYYKFIAKIFEKE